MLCCAFSPNTFMSHLKLKFHSNERTKYICPNDANNRTQKYILIQCGAHFHYMKWIVYFCLCLREHRHFHFRVKTTLHKRTYMPGERQPKRLQQPLCSNKIYRWFELDPLNGRRHQSHLLLVDIHDLHPAVCQCISAFDELCVGNSINRPNMS